MPIFEKLRTPEVQLARHEDDTDVLIKGPPVILVDDLLFRAYDILPLVLKRWGYRHVARRAECRADLYVRPLPLWVIHVVLQFVYLRFLYALHWFYQHQVKIPRYYIVSKPIDFSEKKLCSSINNHKRQEEKNCLRRIITGKIISTRY